MEKKYQPSGKATFYQNGWERPSTTNYPTTDRGRLGCFLAFSIIIFMLCLAISVTPQAWVDGFRLLVAN